MSDNTSVIDAVRLIAKATKDDPTKLSDIVKGALHPDQIDDMRLMLSRARDGSVVHAATTSAAASAPAASAAAGPRDTSVQRRAWKGGANKASAKFEGIPPTSESSLTAASEFPPLSATTTTWSVRTVNRVPSRPRASRRAETPHPTIFEKRRAPSRTPAMPRAPAPEPARPTPREPFLARSSTPRLEESTREARTRLLRRYREEPV